MTTSNLPSMFRNRNNSHKADDELISRFQKAFAGIVPRRDGENGRDGTGGPMMAGRPTGNSETHLRFSNEQTPCNLQDLNFTQSWIGPNNMPMMSLAGQDPGFYTRNSGGIGAIWRPQAGDLHTPTVGLNTITPLSLSNPILQGGIERFNQQYFAPHVSDMNQYVPQASYAPSAFMHRDSGFDSMEETGDGSSPNEIPVDQASNITSAAFSGMDMSYAEGGKFRFNATLRAPTAMVKQAREIPISYLNKGQAYNFSIMDSTPPIVNNKPIQYRTFVRVSFEEEEQRSRPAACWQLWKEGRGTSESHQRGGKLLAVEYVGPLQGGSNDNQRQIQVEQMSFDGFCVTWTVNPTTGTSDCTILVRFNFLSTDFSHSKGVTGIPVRLCAKTELVSPDEESGASHEAEICYCKVKLFRDHGAERKLSNDIAHVTKTIEKLKQQIAQAEMGGGFGKCKRGSNTSVNSKTHRSKIGKHKRTWSASSQDGQPEKLSLEDNLQAKLVIMRMMLSSPRNVSILGLRGEEGDDPDLYPIRLLPDGDFVKVEPLGRQNIGGLQSMESFVLSPTSSNVSKSPRLSPAQAEKLRHPTSVQRISSNGSRVSTGFIEAVDIGRTCRPPAERPPKPIACFYVRFAGNNQQPDYYRAIYLTERTVRDLLKKISEKNHIDPSLILRVLHVNGNGLRIMVDDDVVRELPEGQDMIADIYEAPSSYGAPRSPMEIKLTY